MFHILFLRITATITTNRIFGLQKLELLVTDILQASTRYGRTQNPKLLVASKFKRITDIKIVYSSGCPILFILKVTQGYQPILIKQQ